MYVERSHVEESNVVLGKKQIQLFSIGMYLKQSESICLEKQLSLDWN